jgi:hypothetical protein
MAMTGNLKDMDLAEVIQYLCAGRKATAQVTLENGSQQAMFFFEDGIPTHAVLGEFEGEEVIYEALTWLEGVFMVRNDIKSPFKTINRSWKYLLLEGMRRLDEGIHVPLQSHLNKENKIMANINETLASIMQFDGAIATALVDWKSGMTLGTAGSGMDIELAAAGNTNVVRAKMSVMRDLKIKGGIEDILITLADQYHLIRIHESNPSLFVYLALDRQKANLGLARHKLAQLDHELTEV